MKQRQCECGGTLAKPARGRYDFGRPFADGHLDDTAGVTVGNEI